jgi:hypothetical protein
MQLARFAAPVTLSLVLVTAARFVAVGAAVPGSGGVANGDLYKRMLAVNGDVHTYRANVHVDIAMKSFPFISPSLDGNVYFQQPDRQAVVFDTMPALASQFKKIYPNVDAPSRWIQIYDVALVGDENGVTTFRLVPKKNGRVDHLDVRVDDGTATIRGYTWNYNDGGAVTFDQTFKSVGRDYLVDTQNGHVDLPSYKADIVSNFSNYQLNVALPGGVFEEK